MGMRVRAMDAEKGGPGQGDTAWKGAGKSCLRQPLLCTQEHCPMGSACQMPTEGQGAVTCQLLFSVSRGVA